MKANAKFVQADDAVSPVIAVILMVAITVVLAATVFVLVSNIGGQTKTTPAIGFATNEAADRLEVTSADSTADWNRLGVMAAAFTPTTLGVKQGNLSSCDTTTTGCHNRAVNGAGTYAGANGVNITTQKAVVSGKKVIAAGDYLGFCGDTGALTNVDIRITDTTSNQVIGTYSFQSLAICA